MYAHVHIHIPLWSDGLLLLFKKLEKLLREERTESRGAHKPVASFTFKSPHLKHPHCMFNHTKSLEAMPVGNNRGKG